MIEVTKSILILVDAMNKKLVDMHKNIAKLLKLNFCKILNQDRFGFCAVVNLREGKYKILIDYSIKGHVDIYLFEPEIIVEDYTEIHTYGRKYHNAFRRELLKLCLDHPSKNEWDTSVALIDSYIPWASEWTEFYELWQLTGVWHGEGEHPNVEKDI